MNKSINLGPKIADAIFSEMVRREKLGEPVSFTQVVNERLAKGFDIPLELIELRFNRRRKREFLTSAERQYFETRWRRFEQLLAEPIVTPITPTTENKNE